jgi:hypothetical protein
MSKVHLEAEQLSAFLAAIANTPENKEIIALESAADTLGERTSEMLLNRYGHNVKFLLEISEVNGDPGEFRLNVLVPIGSGFASYLIWGSGGSLVSYLTTHPLPLRLVINLDPHKVVRCFKVQGQTAADNSGNNVTYAVAAVMIL